MNIVHRILASAVALGCVSALALTPAEIGRLVQENNGKANGLMRQITDTCQGMPRATPEKIGTAKDFAKLLAIAAELEKLVQLKEGAPSNCDAAKIHYLLARAYSEPLNLRFTKEARAEFMKAKQLAKSADDQARYAYDYAKFEYQAAEDDEPEKWETAMTAAYATPGLTPSGALSLLASGVPGLDFEQHGWEIVKGIKDVKPRREYFERLLRHTSPQSPSHSLDRTNTPEYWLSVCDRAIENLGAKDAGDFVGRRRGYLRTLGRGDEVERELLALTLGSEDPREVANAYFTLGGHFEAMAQRYYTPDDPGLLAKAVAAYRAACERDPKNGGWTRTLGAALMHAGDYRGFIEQFAPAADFAKPDSWTMPLLGDAYYHLGDWTNAVKCYECLGDGLNPGERTPPNRWDRKANALFALGRYEECLKTVDKLADWLVWKDRKTAYRQKLKALIELPKE